MIDKYTPLESLRLSRAEKQARYWRWWLFVWYKQPDSYLHETGRSIGRFFMNVRDMWPFAKRSNVFLYYFSQKYRYKMHQKLKSKRYGSSFRSKASKIKMHLINDWGMFCNRCKHSFPFHRLTIDHIVPISQGGTNDDDNLQLLCAPCHTDKTKEENRTAAPRKAGAVFSQARPPHRRVRRMVPTKSKVRKHGRVRDMGRTSVEGRYYPSNSVDYP